MLRRVIQNFERLPPTLRLICIAGKWKCNWSYNRFLGSSLIIDRISYSTSAWRIKDRISNRFYSSLSYDFYGYWERLRSSIDSVRWKFSCFCLCFYGIYVPIPRAIDCDVLTLAFIQLLEQYAYNIDSAYLKFTIGYTM